MAFQYRYDVFVSYARVDDIPGPGAQSGWVTTLVRDLKLELARRVGRDAMAIWMDRHPAGTDSPMSERLLQVRQSATLLVIMSPAYLASEWCRHERHEFLTATNAQQGSGSHIFIVEASKVDWQDRPAEFSELQGYRFWEEGPGSGMVRTLDPAAPGLDRSEYHGRLSQLSHDLASALRQLQVPAEALAAAESAGSGSTRTVMAGLDAVVVKSRRLRVPDIAWVEIPGGPYIYQQGEKRELDTFWIGKYPITNRQYQTFVDDNGYDDERWWRDLEIWEPEATPWPQGNRPRTNVNWYEAVAFTRWLTARLDLPAGTIRLPTEYEWEKAARGPEGLDYPWGNEYRTGFANVDETYRKEGPWDQGQTTAVGLYPHGGSLYGVEDLSGTVAEWILNKYDESDVLTVDRSGDPRVLRGGSWGSIPGLARAANRLRDGPDDRNAAFGFRGVSSVPMPVR